MDAMWRDQPEFGFGIDPLYPYTTPRPIEVVGGRTTRLLRDQIQQTCPRVPGVYGMLDRKGQLIYVGKSKSLRSRLLSYFAKSNANEKGGRIIESSRAIQWETQPSEFASLLREQQLIRAFAPRWNVQGVPQRQRPKYLCLGRKPTMFFLAANPPIDCIAIEGPFYGAARMRIAVEALNKVFKLRDCSQKQKFQFAEQLQLFDLELRPGCLRLEVGTCLGPCAAACTHEQYDEAVHAAESFLDGFNHEPLACCQEQFESAMGNQQYELAGRLHEIIKSLQYIDRKLRWLNQARRQFSFVYGVPGYDGCGIWYLIHCGEVADALPVPKSDAQRSAAQPTLQHWSHRTQTRLPRGHGLYPHTLPIVASWFRKNPDELEHSTFAAEAALKGAGAAMSSL